MKYLLLIALALGLLWWWRLLVRKNRGGPSARGTDPSPSHPPGPADDMIACSHCGLHLPRSEALVGGRGSYCSAAHREAAEARSEGS